MQNQTISCPSCGTQIELSETLALPYVEAVKAEYGAKLQQANAEATQAKNLLAQERISIETQKADLESLIAKGIAAKRPELEESIREEIEAGLEADTKAKDNRIENLLSELKLARAEQLRLEQVRQDLELKASSIDLEIAKGINAKLGEIKSQATRDAEETYKLKVAELEKKLTDTNAKLDEAKHKANQGCVQHQGEILETDFEAMLSQTFPWDEVEEVKKGHRGADCLQHVNSNLNQRAGTIIWETKRTLNWGHDWLGKLKADAREARAEIAVLVSEVVPEGIESFTIIEGVWVVKPIFAIALAHVLRECILKTREARKAAEGKETKAGLVYDYVTGQEFRARLEGIAEPFKQMQCDLQSERRLAEQRFNKRQKQLDRVLVSCFGMVGDLQGIAGHDLAELEKVELKALEGRMDEDGVD